MFTTFSDGVNWSSGSFIAGGQQVIVVSSTGHAIRSVQGSATVQAGGTTATQTVNVLPSTGQVTTGPGGVKVMIFFIYEIMADVDNRSHQQLYTTWDKSFLCSWNRVLPFKNETPK